MEPRHLLHSALTHPPSVNVRRLKSGHPFVPAAQQLISLSDNNSIRAALWVDHDGMRRRSGCTTLRGFVLLSTTTLLEWLSQEQRRSAVSDVSALACTNGVWPPLRPVSVAQKNKPSAMLSSNVQSICLLMDYMAWRFRTSDDPMDAQQLPRDPVQPSSGLPEFAETTKMKCV